MDWSGEQTCIIWRWWSVISLETVWSGLPAQGSAMIRSISSEPWFHSCYRCLCTFSWLHEWIMSSSEFIQYAPHCVRCIVMKKHLLVFAWKKIHHFYWSSDFHIIKCSSAAFSMDREIYYTNNCLPEPVPPWLSLVERLIRNQSVGGSNPPGGFSLSSPQVRKEKAKEGDEDLTVFLKWWRAIGRLSWGVVIPERSNARERWIHIISVDALPEKFQDECPALRRSVKGSVRIPPVTSQFIIRVMNTIRKKGDENLLTFEVRTSDSETKQRRGEHCKWGTR